MARVKELALGRPHQVAAYRYARQVLNSGPGGIILADGVGLGKTYEALATIATTLSSREHGKEKKQRQPYRILVVVPPRLITKWADELLLADRFPKYLKGWSGRENTRALANTFEDVVILRWTADFLNQAGQRRYGSDVLPPGLYVANVNLFQKAGRKFSQLHRTPWDAVIVDEAHLTARSLLHREGSTIFSRPKTAVVLLTATPFQLSPSELKHLIEAAGSNRGDEDIYGHPDFREYRLSCNRYFRTGDLEHAKSAAALRSSASELLRKRMIRNSRKGGRVYHLVDAHGAATIIGSAVFQCDEKALDAALGGHGLIEMSDIESALYLRARNLLVSLHSAGKRTFIAAALRQLLSTYQQFAGSAANELAKLQLPTTPHPKLRAACELVVKLVSDELRTAKTQNWIGKILVFTTYVGAEHSAEVPTSEEAHGTSAALKRTLEHRLREFIQPPQKKQRLRIFAALKRTLDRHGEHLDQEERQRLIHRLRVFAGTRMAGVLLISDTGLRHEMHELRKSLRTVTPTSVEEESAGEDLEIQRRLSERRNRRFRGIIDRYTTRDLVARYDGAIGVDQRDSHLRGFNSPFQPLVLIASSVGQEGIDLQRFCRHVIHYDLEWNPAKVEQREGRVDREGRVAGGPVNVYFLLCRGTYDERVLHVMANRFRWHAVLLGSGRILDRDPGSATEPELKARILKKLVLDLRPR